MHKQQIGYRAWERALTRELQRLAVNPRLGGSIWVPETVHPAPPVPHRQLLTLALSSSLALEYRQWPMLSRLKTGWCHMLSSSRLEKLLT